MALTNMNLGANQQNVYKQNSAQTASPGELTLMLYNGCLKFISQAKTAMDENRIQDRNTALKKAQAIVSELMVTLKVEDETSENMMRLYDYINNRLVRANIKNDKDILEEAEQMVIQFRNTWKQVIQAERQRKYGGGAS
ncbi:flagellar export chaperone FliS [Salsuginibacillus halophilus]|nr:flagellar export chaperone FliS [Salsuginibacillus halophilus]